MLTVAKCLAVVDHAIDTDGIPSGPDAPPSALEVVNFAGVLLTTMHRWKWNDALSVSLDLVDGQEWVDLPEGTQSVLSLGQGVIAYPVTLVPYNVLDGLRKNGTVYGPQRQLYAAVESVSPSGSNPARIPRLAIYPVPDEDVSGAIRVTVYRGWTPVEADDTMTFPAYMEPLYLEILRETARGWYEEDEQTLEGRMLKVRSGILFRSAAETDGLVQFSAGPIINGHTGQVSVRPEFYGGPVELPS